jgi:hypothetical protein
VKFRGGGVKIQLGEGWLGVEVGSLGGQSRSLAETDPCPVIRWLGLGF